MNSQQTILRSGVRSIIGAVLASTLMCSTSLAQTPAQQPQPQRPRAVAPAAPAAAAHPAAAAPARPAPAVAAVPAAAAAPRVAEGEVVARIGGRDVTTTEVRNFISGLGAREQVALARDPALLSQAVRLMLANQLVLKEAEGKKWQDQPAVAAQLQRIKDGAIVESYLQTVSNPPSSYPEEAEILKAYDANKTAFLVPRQFRIAQIFVALETNADNETKDKARKKLTELQGKLKQPKADFAAIAQESSDQRDTAERGGELGWVPENQIRPEIKTQVMGLSNGAMSEPIQLDDGWHIIKLIETKAAETRSLADVREVIVQQLRSQRAEAIRRAYLARVLEQSPPAINELALAKVFNQQPDATPTR
ncbi:unnamed protein product [Phaeothamnion confervicola]